MILRTLVAFTLFSSGVAIAQAPSETSDDPNQQQVVPEISLIPKPDSGYGTVVGQLIWDGAIPEKQLLHKKGAATVKDALCAVEDHYQNSLVIDEKTKAIRDIFVYEKSGTYRKNADAIHPDLREPKKNVYFDQKGCRFFPKSLLVRSGQKVMVLSNDNVSHNTHTFPLKNRGDNFVIGPNDRSGRAVELPVAETLPISVKCDLHGWMEANWLVVDHPYMAVSNKGGRFMIANLPAGTHEVRLWHKRAGYLHKKIGTASTPQYTVKSGKMSFEVKDGEVLDLKQIKLKAEWFED